jgi:hypothetical protein
MGKTKTNGNVQAGITRTAYNTAFATLANMKVVGTRRKCPERYARSHIGVLLRVKGIGLFFKEGNEKGLIYSRVNSLGKGIKIDVLLGRLY